MYKYVYSYVLLNSSVNQFVFYFFVVGRSLPYTVTQDEALSYEEVRLRLNKGLETLTTMVTVFIERIIGCCHMLPFSITYMARVLHHSLIKKFPFSPEKEILKVKTFFQN